MALLRRLWENRFLRGIVLVALVSLAIVLLSLEESLQTAGALVRVAFFLAIAFFLFLLWRERRGELEAWTDLSRRTFYGAVALAVVAIGALIGLAPTGADLLAFLAVIACCAWAILRVWRREHRYG
jgi:O-antigen/teichoic acid export membrane protein